jgi:serine/threonine protein kinase
VPASNECPEIESWQALFRDPGHRDEWEHYEQHLESCTACQDRLDRAVELSGLVRRLGREVGDPTKTPDDPTLSRFLGQLHRVTAASDVGTNGPADLSFLRPVDRSELLGMLDEYEVIEVIGQGGFGVVLKAHEPALHRLVAIKVLSPALAGSATARRRFTREAQAAAAVCHDHVVAVHAVRETVGLPYFVMQYVGGESLQARLDLSGPLETAEIVRIGMQTAQGLAAAHAQGLIHRDIKPANLLLENGLARVKITDFGLARAVDDVGLTQDGVVAGTPEYMAPEQARGEVVDARCDLFSLGSVLYAMCVGHSPFRASTTVALLRQVSDQEPRPIRSLNPDIPGWLEALIARLMAKNPAARIQSAAEVAALLEAYLAHLREPRTILAPKLPAWTGKAPDQRPQGRFVRGQWIHLFVAASVLLAALGTALITWLAGGTDEPKPPSEYRDVFYQSLKGPLDRSLKLEFFGPDAEECVRFEPDGYRLRLPAGYEGMRPGNGITIPVVVRGDFEVTVNFEILKEPEPALAETTQTRFTLDAVLNRAGALPGSNVATFSRRAGRGGGTRFLTWYRWWDESIGDHKDRTNSFPTRATSGRLRMVRTGPDLAFYALEDSDEEFRFLQKYTFGTEDLKWVRLVGATGGAQAMLEVRATDLRIRAESLPELGTAVATPAPAGKPRFALWQLFGLLLTLSLVGLAAWLYARRGRRGSSPDQSASVPDEPAGAEPTAASVSFACSGCGKKLKARAERAGKKVKCPQCGQAVSVPDGGS